MSEELIELAFPGSAAAIAEGERRSHVVNGWPVLLTRTEGRLLAVIDRCTHAAATLSEGRVRRGAIMCPLHGARFDLASGRCIGGPYLPLKTFPVRLEGDEIFVTVPATPPPPELRPVMPI